MTYTGNNEKVTLYDLNGSVLFEENIQFQNNQAEIKANLKANKVYVVKVGNETIKFTLN